MSKSGVTIFILLLLVLAEGGFILYYFVTPKIFPKFTPSTIFQTDSKSLISFQALPIQGKIIEINGQTISVKSNKGVTGRIGISDNVSIIPPTENNQIILNKEVILNLQDEGQGKYTVSSIIYIPNQQEPSTSSNTLPVTNPETPSFSPPPAPEALRNSPKPSPSPSEEES